MLASPSTKYRIYMANLNYVTEPYRPEDTLMNLQIVLDGKYTLFEVDKESQHECLVASS